MKMIIKISVISFMYENDYKISVISFMYENDYKNLSNIISV